MIFLDYNATTPLSDAAQDAMQELAGTPLNPSSIHAFGRKSKSYVNKARKPRSFCEFTQRNSCTDAMTRSP